MKLSIKAMAAACGLLWAGAMLVGGVCHLVWPSYALPMLRFAASIYPGYHPDGGAAGVAVGTLYALVDGSFGGALLAWIYNQFAG